MFGTILGALIGAGLGLAFSSGRSAAALAVLGALFGHLLERLRRPSELSAWPAPTPSDDVPALDPLPPPRSRDEIESESRAQQAIQLGVALVEVARADGPLQPEELLAARELAARGLGLPRELDLLSQALAEASHRAPELSAALEACAEPLSPRERREALDALYRVALADGDLRRGEHEALRRAAEVFGIPEDERQRIAARHLGEEGGAYAVLGLTPAASDDEVRSAFRRLAAALHPDRAAHRGRDAEEAAARQFRELREAYEAIRRRRGL